MTYPEFKVDYQSFGPDVIARSEGGPGREEVEGQFIAPGVGLLCLAISSWRTVSRIG